MYIFYSLSSIIFSVTLDYLYIHQAMKQDSQTELLRNRYTEALVRGDPGEAHRVVTDAMERGIGQVSIYFEIFAQALSEIGRAWREGGLSVAAEHHATSITLQEISYVGQIWRTRRKKDIGLTVALAAVEGEMHSVAMRMIGDLLHMEGWDVADLGQDNPTEDLVELVRDRKTDLVILSLSQLDRIGAAQRAAEMLKALETPPVVFVGGAVLSDVKQAGRISADLVTSDPIQALAVAGQLFGLGRERVELQDHLSALGQNVLELRRERGWSQKELAERASLDRTYISAVEKGRQNITIGAALRIADALGTSLSRLIG